MQESLEKLNESDASLENLAYKSKNHELFEIRKKVLEENLKMKGLLLRTTKIKE